jgi:hypothetical protein
MLKNNGGDAFFQAILNHYGPDTPLDSPLLHAPGQQSLWLSRNGALLPIASPGQPAPGVPGTLSAFPEFVSEFAGLNNRGDLVLSLRVETSGSDFRPASIWLLPANQPPSSMRPIVTPGN